MVEIHFCSSVIVAKLGLMPLYRLSGSGLNRIEGGGSYINFTVYVIDTSVTMKNNSFYEFSLVVAEWF